MNGTLNQTAWESAWDLVAHGDSITIVFYANDTAGNVGSTNVTVEKYAPPSGGGLDPVMLVIIIGSAGGGAAAVGIGLYLRKRKRKDWTTY